jgi:hypothetical protein
LALQPLVIEAEELVAPGDTGLRGVQPQLLKSLDGRVEVGGVKEADGGASLRQSSLRGDNKVQAPKTHVCAWDLAFAVASHPRPAKDDETRKRPLLGAPTIGVSNR